MNKNDNSTPEQENPTSNVGTLVTKADFEEAAKSLLKSRDNTLSLYKQVMSYQPFAENPLLREVLEDLCEQLVDYSGKVHFALLNNIEGNFAEKPEILDIANNISRLLVENTQKILDFQDAYNGDVETTDIEQLTNKLSQVGEIIANRITLEDKLIDAILKDTD
ncbi:MAG: Rsd/AlgQ family anti-sigma factor [Pseudomonadota bacterium]